MGRSSSSASLLWGRGPSVATPQVGAVVALHHFSRTAVSDLAKPFEATTLQATPQADLLIRGKNACRGCVAKQCNMRRPSKITNRDVSAFIRSVKMIF
jgi:hypothetical protein